MTPIFQYTIFMFGLRQRNTSRNPCWNGPGCYYLRQGRCHFYHPPSHTRTSSPPATQQLHSATRRIDDFSSLIEQILKARQERLKKQKNEQIEKYFKVEPQKKFVPPALKLNGQVIQEVKIETSIEDKDRAWFFKNCHHFHYFPGCPYEECSICLEQYEKDSQDLLSYLFCKHTFHRKCIENWLKTSVLCPLCKQDFRKHKDFESYPDYKQPRSSRLAHFRLPFFNSLDRSYDEISPDVSFISEDDYEVDYDDEPYDAFSDNFEEETW